MLTFAGEYVIITLSEGKENPKPERKEKMYEVYMWIMEANTNEVKIYEGDSYEGCEKAIEKYDQYGFRYNIYKGGELIEEL